MQTDQNNRDSQTDPWDACPQGELSHMVKRLDAAGRSAARKRIFAGTLACTALFAGVAFLAGSLLESGLFLHGGITCAECKSHFADYHGHLTQTSLLADTDLVASMETHIQKCGFCRGMFDSTYPNVLTNNFPTDGPSAYLAMRPQFSVDLPHRLW